MARSSKITNVTVGNVSQTLLPPSPNRVALVLVGPNAGRVTISTDSPVTLDAGITLSKETGAIYLDYETHGTVVCAAIFANADAASRVVGIIETLEG